MYVKSLTFENIKAFRELRFDFTRPDNTLQGWSVFVGGNASGKSTILKAIALILSGPTAGRQLIGSTAGWITGGEKQGRAKVEILWDSKHDRFKPGGAPPGARLEGGVGWEKGKDHEQGVLKG